MTYAIEIKSTNAHFTVIYADGRRLFAPVEFPAWLEIKQQRYVRSAMNAPVVEPLTCTTYKGEL